MAPVIIIRNSSGQRHFFVWGLTQVKSKAPSPAYIMCRILSRMKMQRMPKTIRTIKQTKSTPWQEVKSYLVCGRNQRLTLHWLPLCQGAINVHKDVHKPVERRWPLQSTQPLWSQRPWPLSQCHGSWRSFPPCRRDWESGWTESKRQKYMSTAVHLRVEQNFRAHVRNS